MKLIIDIPEVDYECAKQRWMKANDANKMDYYMPQWIKENDTYKMNYYISKGIPLDDVKAEIEKEENIWYHDCEPENDWKKFDVIRVDTVFEILDNISKAESEET